MAGISLRRSIRQVLRQVKPFCQEKVKQVIVHVDTHPWIAILVLADGQRIRLPVYATPKNQLAKAGQPFVPGVLQRKILQSLDHKALRTDALADACGCERSRLFKKKIGLAPLKARGLVKNSREVGYYRPDALPPEMTQ